MSLIIDGTNGVTFNDSSLQGAAASPFALKNRIINGDMRIAQRGTSAISTDSGGAHNYFVDRWCSGNSQASKFTGQQSTVAPTGFSNSLLITSTSAYTVGSGEQFIVQQIIEGFNWYDLGWGTSDAKTITLSFWVRSSLTGTFGGCMQNDNGSRQYPFSYTISSVNTWEQKTITITGDTSGTWVGSSNAAATAVVFSMGAGSTISGTAGAWTSSYHISTTGATSVVGTNGATFYITGVQLEIGSTATPFERRLYNQELANCQRYYQLLDHLSLSAARGTTSIETSFMFPVWMRATPTIDSSVGQGYQIYDAFGNGFTQSSFNGAFAVTGATQKGGFISLGNFTGLTQGRTYVTNAANVGKFGLSAEL
jgi:hypothetical protein